MKLVVAYMCSKCGLEGHKLWREYNTFADHLALHCLKCAEKHQKKKINLGRLPKDENDERWERPTDQIGWFVPAVPVDGEDTYWGYTSVPNGALRWWHLLPTFKNDPVREVEWLRAWAHAWQFGKIQLQSEELRRRGFEVK